MKIKHIMRMVQYDIANKLEVLNMERMCVWNLRRSICNLN